MNFWRRTMLRIWSITSANWVLQTRTSTRRVQRFLGRCSALPGGWATQEYFEIGTIALIATLCRVALQKVVRGGGSLGKGPPPF